MYKYTNEKEILAALERQALLIEQKRSSNIITLDNLNEELPGLSCVSTHDLSSFRSVYQSDKALKLADTSREEYLNEPVKYVNKITYPGDLQKGIVWIQRHLASHQSERPTGFMQRLKLFGKQDYRTFYTLTKKDTKKNELISIYVPVNEFGFLSSKIFRLLEEELLFKANYYRFMSLTSREKEIITRLAAGFQNNEIADQLFISKSTVEQHRKNLKRKLEIKRFVDLIRFAQAFDLI